MYRTNPGGYELASASYLFEPQWRLLLFHRRIN